uniref:Uncharacterized protein n=1 Tax=Heterorhabditis bacteriophora TaxID=37862 RepID=A0A1I7XTS7_HETBA
MDPHHLQNNVNINMGVQGQPQQMNPQSQGQYNPQVILAQQQYMNSFNTFYGNNQVSLDLLKYPLRRINYHVE